MTIYQMLHDDEEGPVDDWRGLIARLADEIIRTHYQDETRRWPGPFNRRVLEDVLDTVHFPDNLRPNDVQALSQAVSNETEHLLAVLGAALAMTWPASPLEFADWPERAIALSGLRADQAGIPIHAIGRELQRAGFGKQRPS